jgi:hypothetical protein
MDNLPPYDNDPPVGTMFEPFRVPKPHLDLMAGLSLDATENLGGQVRFTQGVGQLKGRRYASIQLSGVFADEAGRLWREAEARRVPAETALVAIPAAAWRFRSRLDEDLAQERLQEYELHASRSYGPVVWRVYGRLDAAMDWASYTRSIREKAWLTLARATRAAAGYPGSYLPAWYSYTLDDAIRALYPRYDTILACARRWLSE